MVQIPERLQGDNLNTDCVVQDFGDRQTRLAEVSMNSHHYVGYGKTMVVKG